MAPHHGQSKVRCPDVWGASGGGAVGGRLLVFFDVSLVAWWHSGQGKCSPRWSAGTGLIAPHQGQSNVRTCVVMTGTSGGRSPRPYHGAFATEDTAARPTGTEPGPGGSGRSVEPRAMAWAGVSGVPAPSIAGGAGGVSVMAAARRLAYRGRRVGHRGLGRRGPVGPQRGGPSVMVGGASAIAGSAGGAGGAGGVTRGCPSGRRELRASSYC